MATLVTGGTGFIGSNIVKELAEKGNQVVSLDIVPPDDLVLRYTEPWAGQITWINADILDVEALDKVAALDNIDKVIHAATHTPYGDTEKDDFRRAVDINVMGTVNVLDLSRRLAVKRFMYISTESVYCGAHIPSLPCREDMPLKPSGPLAVYTVGKYCCEGLTQRYGELFGFSTVSVRPDQNWGPMERVTPYHTRLSIPYDWVGKALRNEPIELSLWGTGIAAEYRYFNVDHSYVLDTVAAIRELMDAPLLSHLVYNIASGHPLMLHEMVSAMRQVFPEVKFVEPTAKAEPAIPRRVKDVTNLREDVGFVEQYDLVSALIHYLKWREDFNFTS